MEEKNQIPDNKKASQNLVEMTRRLESTEKKLTAEKTFSNFLIQESTAAIVILDTDFTIIHANEAYLKTVNKSREEVIGASCHEISHGVSVPCSSAFPGVKCPMVETLRTGENVHVIHDHKGPDGKPVYCNLNTYPIKDEAGEVVEVIEFWRDITDEFSNRWDKQVKKINSNIQKLVQEDRMISLGKLAASCAHEINNPIQGLLTFSHLMMDILSEGDLSAESLEEFKDHLSLMARELERCGNIVSGLLSFSRESSVEYKQADLNEIINSVLSLTRHKLALGNIGLIIDLFPEPLMLEGDINQLQQCFLNLIFNALEAMPEQGHLTVVSKPDLDRNQAIIEIRDTGYGIPEESRNNLFDPFFTTKSQGQGTGLGLSIVYGVVKNHKGTIKVDTRVGEGTAFILKFPLS
ncbi:two-component system sensor histidine kinase NtrB [Desulfospira joergensenii]|uniref:two-component system sensor histidine kinase NtrB n=1 Tax=Desulfospira joergensenii TaxID=53329 RepID=UPI0003B7BB17|nr:ATP-binding protein [Desulfospira joergensenii]